MANEDRLQVLIDLPILNEFEVGVLRKLQAIRGDSATLGTLGWDDVLPPHATNSHRTWLNRLTVAGLIVQHPGNSENPNFSISYVGEQVLEFLTKREL